MSWKIGDLCVAKSKQFGWTNSEIKQVNEDIAKVEFIEYDGDEEVNISDLKLFGPSAVNKMGELVEVNNDDCDYAGWKVGDECVAQWTQDGVWYNSQILHFFNEDEILVRFVDYGNADFTALGNLKPAGSPLENAVCRSLNCPSPILQFGPCGQMMKNSAMVMTIQDPASQRLAWYKPPLTVLIIKKVRDAMVIPPFIQLVRWFIHQKHMVVFVESAIMDDPLLTNNTAFGHIQDKLKTFDEKKDDLTDKIDFVVCLGGDGTLLYASSLFQQCVPPTMAFHLGSLGFLTPFKFEDFQSQVTHVLEGHAALTLRSRLRCIVLKKDQPAQQPSTNMLVLNEVVIDRGPSPYLSNIDLYLNGKLITSVQGDGLIVSTPTGSTAYSAAAGASMTHPSVQSVMVTPICPHSLSFRPIVVPAGVELKISVSPDSRNTAWVSFDGRMRQELCHGDSLRVTTSIYPIPSICSQDQITDWFASLAECLHWNDRKKQLTLDELRDEGLLHTGDDNGEDYSVAKKDS